MERIVVRSGLDWPGARYWEVPVDAVTAERERCAKIADMYAHCEESADDTMHGHLNAAPYLKVATEIRRGYKL